MKQSIKDVEEEILTHLEDYLQSQGVKIDNSGMMSCPIPDCNHAHGDRNKSCGFVPHTNRKMIRCFSGLESVNIFHLVNKIEGLPRTDSGFYHVTLPELAKRYGIDYEPEEMTPEQEHRLKMESAYRDAANIVRNGTDFVKDYILQRGWDIKEVSRLGVGAVKDYKTFVAGMQKLGWKSTYLQQINLIAIGPNESPIFKEDNLIFTIKSPSGYPVAFVARDPNYQANNTAKYYNTPTHTLYNKKQTLYMFDEARKNRVGPLWVVEGYADAITLHTKGINRVTALGSAAFTEEHATLLDSDPSVGEIILAFDGDETGQKCIKRALEKLAPYTRIRVQVCVMPDGEDPDSMVNKSIDHLLNLERVSSFRYLLGQGEELTHQFVEEYLIPEVARQGPVMAKGMIDDISSESGIEVAVLQDGLDFYKDEFGEARRAQKSTLATDTRKRLERDPDNISLILQTALENAKTISDLQTNYDPRITLTENYNVMMQRYRDNDPNLIGWNMPNLPSIADKLDGLSRNACVSFWGGLPSVGKSTLCRNIAKEIAFHNEDAMVIYMSVDDSSQSVIRSWAAADIQMDMKSLIRYQSLTAKDQEIWETSFNKLKNQDNLIVFDGTQGNSMDDLQWHIDYFRKHYPNRQPIVFIDSLNTIGMSDSNLRESMMNTSKQIKRTANKHDIHIAVVSNLRKSNKLINRHRDGDNPDVDMYYRPHPEEISESIHLWYEAELLVLCHNHHAIHSSTQLKWDYISDKGEHVNMPYLEAYVWKNKTESPWVSDGFATQLFFKLNGYQSSIEAVDFKTLPTTGMLLNNIINQGKETLDKYTGIDVSSPVEEIGG